MDLTEADVSVLLRTNSSHGPDGKELSTRAYAPEPGETVAELVQRLLTTVVMFDETERVASHDDWIELRVIERPEA